MEINRRTPGHIYGSRTHGVILHIKYIPYPSRERHLLHAICGLRIRATSKGNPGTIPGTVQFKVANLYGLSETGPTHIDDPLAPGWKTGTIGIPLDVNDVKIYDENDEELGPNETGEIVVKGDNVFVGYYRNEALYRDVVKNGYFHTGDLGYKDENGIYYFVDRKKDLIIKGGMNIVPGEIDEILMRHPAVKEGVTIGVPDEMFGEEVKSFVVAKDGMTITQAEIIAHCSHYLPKTKVPKYVEITDDIPKTHSGKLLRKELRKR